MEQFSQSKVVAFGDSVMWGQGIAHKNKFTTLIAKKLFGISFTQADNHAHSGAKILSNGRLRSLDHPKDTQIPVYGEIPRSDPSIRRQLISYGVDIPTNANVSPEAINTTFPNTELVFLNGGINDIDAFKLVTGDAGNFGQISRSVTRFCETEFFNLLTAARRKFPNAQLMSIGYHFVLSVASLKSLVDIIGLAVREDNQTIALYRKGISSCHYFMALSTAAFQKAVDKFNLIDLEKGNKGAFFVPTLHTENNASFAPRSLSWGIEKVGDRILSQLMIALFRNNLSPLIEVIKLKDEVIEERRAMCNIYRKNDLLANAQCHMASLFHPNSKSAEIVSSIASKTFGAFSGTISLRHATKGKELSVIKKRLGFTKDVSVRQLFATNTIASIQLKGVIKSGSTGVFPYHFLTIKITTSRTSFRYKLNHLLPFIKGFADGKDDVYPTPTGKITARGGLSTEGNTVRDESFNFFAYPNRIIPLNDVKKVTIEVPKVSQMARHARMHMFVRNLQLIINGRSIPLIMRNTTFLASGNAATSSDIIFHA